MMDNRVIEFQAWDTRRKVMLCNVTVYGSNFGECHIGFGYDYAVEVYGTDFIDGLEYRDIEGDGDWCWLLDGFILRQFTGATGMNDVKLFEFDIVKLHSPIKKYNGAVGEIVYITHGMPGFVVKLVFGRPYSFYGKEMSSGFTPSQLELIGNRFQTLELLGENDER